MSVQGREADAQGGRTVGDERGLWGKAMQEYKRPEAVGGTGKSAQVGRRQETEQAEKREEETAPSDETRRLAAVAAGETEKQTTPYEETRRLAAVAAAGQEEEQTGRRPAGRPAER